MHEEAQSIKRSFEVEESYWLVRSLRSSTWVFSTKSSRPRYLVSGFGERGILPRDSKEVVNRMSNHNNQMSVAIEFLFSGVCEACRWESKVHCVLTILSAPYVRPPIWIFPLPFSHPRTARESIEIPCPFDRFGSKYQTPTMAMETSMTPCLG